MIAATSVAKNHHKNVCTIKHTWSCTDGQFTDKRFFPSLIHYTRNLIAKKCVRQMANPFACQEDYTVYDSLFYVY